MCINFQQLELYLICVENFDPTLLLLYSRSLQLHGQLELLIAGDHVA
jgi:hypothetical protein